MSTVEFSLAQYHITYSSRQLFTICSPSVTEPVFCFLYQTNNVNFCCLKRSTTMISIFFLSLLINSVVHLFSPYRHLMFLPEVFRQAPQSRLGSSLASLYLRWVSLLFACRHCTCTYCHHLDVPTI